MAYRERRALNLISAAQVSRSRCELTIVDPLHRNPVAYNARGDSGPTRWCAGNYGHRLPMIGIIPKADEFDSSSFGKRDRAPELMRGSQGSGRDRPAIEGTYNGSFLWPVGNKGKRKPGPRREPGFACLRSPLSRYSVPRPWRKALGWRAWCWCAKTASPFAPLSSWRRRPPRRFRAPSFGWAR